MSYQHAGAAFMVHSSDKHPLQNSMGVPSTESLAYNAEMHRREVHFSQKVEDFEKNKQTNKVYSVLANET